MVTLHHPPPVLLVPGWQWQNTTQGCQAGSCAELETRNVGALTGPKLPGPTYLGVSPTVSCGTSTTQVVPTGYNSTDLLFPALQSNKDKGSCVSKRKILFCSIAETVLEGFRGPAETCEVMEVILQWEQKEEGSIHGDTTSHFSRQEATLRGRTSPLPLCHPHTYTELQTHGEMQSWWLQELPKCFLA